MLHLLRNISLTAILLLAQPLWAQQGQAPGATPAALIRVAVVQLDSAGVGNFAAMQALANQARAQGAMLIVFPEASVFGWLNPKVFTDAAPIPGIYSAQFAAIAMNANIWVAAGLAERGPQMGTNPDVYQAYDAGILLNPQGEIVLHHRKYAVLKNAFNPSDCPAVFGGGGCGYSAGPLSDIKTAQTPFGSTALLVCADAYTFDTTALAALKPYRPQLVIVPWGVTAGSQADCGQSGFNATGYAAQAAAYLQTAYVVGANATGPRPYGRFLPSWYCGNSGFATPSGQVGGMADGTQPIAYFEIPACPNCEAAVKR